ncbi:MAG: glutathione-independent formaldehyde dehydrogenase [Burkholderia sp.]|nr:glutathione-independent formaldehyde dehydrogenase [Burkholderia sp.]
MRALTYHGAHDVRIDNVPDPILQEDDDIVLRVTATAICGADLHLYRGKMPGLERGDILGHEFMGIIEEVGPNVARLKRGDRVVVPYTISCGECFFCSKKLYAACENTNPDEGESTGRIAVRPGAGMFGYTNLYGGYPGGQAEFVRVPRANVGPMKVPAVLPDEKVLFLSDILPTGYQAALNADIEPGSTIAIFGAGPVGYMTAACARLLGAERIFMVDHHPYRLRFAEDAYGVEAVNFDKVADPAEFIIEQTGFRGVDASIDAIGFEAKGSIVEKVLTNIKLEGSSGKALRGAIAATRRGGTVSVPGFYLGFLHAFMAGYAFDKGLTFRMGHAHVQRYMPELLEYIESGALKPEAIITHHLPLADAPRGYQIFDRKEENCRKVVLTPAGPHP